ncbi:MAG: cytochrome c biogenesis protein ResB [Betaproteobacteria bacterium]|nr:cytochrome c biogenesis protein ResB [Betaproteobacteria bacterium]
MQTATQSSFPRAVYELLSSMRLAISLLTVLAIASVIGTVLKQNEPYSNYMIELGPFWFKAFAALGLYDVYHAGWFLAILLFLILSVGFCIYRQTPLMLREIKSFREHATEASLRGFAHQASYPLEAGKAAAMQRLTCYLAGQGFRFKLGADGGDAQPTLIAAKAGSLTRLGYILTHSAIVIICIGGLIDGNVPLKVQELLGYKKTETRDLPSDKVPAISRLTPANLSFRGSVSIPEAGSADVVYLNLADGYLVQDLPFQIQLKKFRIEHYATGQPKSFESDIVITDPDAKKAFEGTVSVNHPIIYKGVAIYQASFGDGGSRLAMNGWSLLSPAAKPFPFKGVVNQSSSLSNGDAQYTVEITDFKMFNVQDADEKADAAQPPGFWQNASRIMDDAASSAPKKRAHNVGPSYQYKIRDAQGQAREYHNFMLPLQIDGRSYLVSGMRAAPNEPFRYVRFPADENGGVEGYMRLRAALFDKALHPEIARRFAAAATQGAAVNEALRAKLVDSTGKVLEIFAHGGFEDLAKFIEGAVDKAEQEKAAETYLKVLERALFEANQLVRQRDGLKPLPPDMQSVQFVRESLNAINDSFYYGNPVYLQLKNYEEVLSSGLQLTRSPGKTLVYSGSVLLVLGLFAMFYIRERRIWLLVQPDTVLFAMSSNRKTLDFENEFRQHQQNLAGLLKG